MVTCFRRVWLIRVVRSVIFIVRVNQPPLFPTRTADAYVLCQEVGGGKRYLFIGCHCDTVSKYASSMAIGYLALSLIMWRFGNGAQTQHVTCVSVRVRV